MNRILQPWAEDIAAAVELTEPWGLGNVDFLCGTDPVYAGLHPYEQASHGRSYRDTGHCAYAHQTFDGRTTVVMPVVMPWWDVVHELGHVLDERQGWRWNLPAITDYANDNRAEAFAEAFTAYVVGETRQPGWAEGWDALCQWDPPAIHVFSTFYRKGE